MLDNMYVCVSAVCEFSKPGLSGLVSRKPVNKKTLPCSGPLHMATPLEIWGRGLITSEILECLSQRVECYCIKKSKDFK